MKWDVGKLKTWFVFEIKIIQTKRMENLKFGEWRIGTTKVPN